MNVKVKIEGTTALLQNRFNENAEVSIGQEARPVKIQDLLPRQQAEAAAYRMPDGERLYHPGAAISRLLRESGASHKQKGSRKSLKYIVPAAVIVMTDAIVILDINDKPLGDFEVDSRPVVIPATKGRIMRHRPRHDQWRMVFHLRINEDVLSAATIHQLLTEGGARIGVGDFRPEKGGPFGTFRVIEWEVLKD